MLRRMYENKIFIPNHNKINPLKIERMFNNQKFRKVLIFYRNQKL